MIFLLCFFNPRDGCSLQHIYNKIVRPLHSFNPRDGCSLQQYTWGQMLEMRLFQSPRRVHVATCYENIYRNIISVSIPVTGARCNKKILHDQSKIFHFNPRDGCMLQLVHTVNIGMTMRFNPRDGCTLQLQ